MLPENVGYVFMAPVSHGSTASNDECFLAILITSSRSAMAGTVSLFNSDNRKLERHVTTYFSEEMSPTAMRGERNSRVAPDITWQDGRDRVTSSIGKAARNHVCLHDLCLFHQSASGAINSAIIRNPPYSCIFLSDIQKSVKTYDV